MDLNIIDTALRAGVFQTFTRLLEGSVLERELRCNRPYTLFAPMDIAFAYLPSEVFGQLLEADRQGILGKILGYHAVPQKLTSHELKDLSSAKTVYGEQILITNLNGLRIGGAKLVEVDIEARNGIIHAIDRILLPAKTASPPQPE